MGSENKISEIDKLANFIMAEIDNEPSQSEGAGTCAVRIIKQLRAKIEAWEKHDNKCRISRFSALGCICGLFKKGK